MLYALPMRFDAGDQANGSEIEDRRGGGFRFPGGGIGAGAGGLGIIGLIVVGLVRLLGGDVVVGDAPPQGQPQQPSPQQPSPQQQPGPVGQAQPHAGQGGATLGGSCAGVTSATDQGKFIACVETNVQAFWARTLSSGAAPYRIAKLVLFTDATRSGCGTASAQSGPFYCPPDEKVYLDLGFFEELHRRFHAKGGDFAEAYIVAHEYGHHVQKLLGIEERMRSAQRARPGDRNALSVQLELQADCFAGVWGHSAYEKGKVASDEIAQALDAAASVGDDRIQKEARGRITPETFTHGSAADRQRWFGRGMNSGDPKECDTFASQP